MFDVDTTDLAESATEVASKIGETPSLEFKPIQEAPIVERVMTFGDIEVIEEPNVDFVSEAERGIYKEGMNTLESLCDISSDAIEKMVLLTPDTASNIVGMQPLVSMPFGEAAMVYQLFDRAGIDFQNNYSLMEAGKKDMYYMVNNQAAEAVLRANATTLGIEVPNTSLTNQEIRDHVKNLINNSDTRVANIAHGILSGFPPSECQSAVDSGRFNNAPPKAKDVENMKKRFTVEKGISTLWREKQLNPINYLRVQMYKPGYGEYTPDTTTQKKDNSDSLIVEAYGLRWSAKNPPTTETMERCQKLMQVDRELGLLKFVSETRSGYSEADNVRRITTSRRLLNFV